MYKRKICYRVEKRVLKFHNNVKICCSTEVSFLMLIWILVFQFDPPYSFLLPSSSLSLPIYIGYSTCSLSFS